MTGTDALRDAVRAALLDLARKLVPANEHERRALLDAACTEADARFYEGGDTDETCPADGVTEDDGADAPRAPNHLEPWDEYLEDCGFHLRGMTARRLLDHAMRAREHPIVRDAAAALWAAEPFWRAEWDAAVKPPSTDELVIASVTSLGDHTIASSVLLFPDGSGLLASAERTTPSEYSDSEERTGSGSTDLLDPRTLARVREISGHPIRMVDTDGRVLITEHDEWMGLLDLTSGKVIWQGKLDMAPPFAWAPDGGFIGATVQHGPAEPYQAIVFETRAPAREGHRAHFYYCRGHDEPITALCFLPDRLVSAGQELKVWSLFDRRAPSHGQPNRHPATAEPLLDHLTCQRTIARTGPPVTLLRATQDGRAVFAASEGEVAVWDLTTGALRRRFESRGASITALAELRDGRLLAARNDGTACLWDSLEPEPRWSRSIGAGPVYSLAEHPERPRGLAVTPDGIGTFDLSTGSPGCEIRHTDRFAAITVSKSGRIALAGDHGVIAMVEWR
jgi:hypothetical protein